MPQVTMHLKYSYMQVPLGLHCAVQQASLPFEDAILYCSYYYHVKRSCTLSGQRVKHHPHTELI